MNGDERKAAKSAYLEREVEAGIYALRCAPTGEIWVGGAPDLATIQNRLWFTLGLGNNPHRTLQAAWNIHGAEAFSFEIIERFETAPSAYLRSRMMKDRLTVWTERLQAVRL